MLKMVITFYRNYVVSCENYNVLCNISKIVNYFIYIIVFKVSVFKFCPYIKSLKLRQNVEIFKTTDLNDLVTLKNVSGLILEIMRFYSPNLLKTKPQLCFFLKSSVL